jgi:hypothetical protein
MMSTRTLPKSCVGGAAATGLILGVLLRRGGNGREPEATQRKYLSIALSWLRKQLRSLLLTLAA